MNDSPLVSIITVTFNAQETLEQTMSSVFNQTYSNIEYILVDGLSTDGTVDIIKKYESKLSVWISEKDQGIYDAMNKGIGLAKGDIIGMINAGDYYEPDAVESVIRAYRENPDIEIFHGNMNMLDAQGDFCKVKRPNPDLSAHYKGMAVYHPTFFVLKSVYEKHGCFDLQFKIAADFDFILRNHLCGTSFFYIDKVIASFRMGGISQTAGKRTRIECRDALYKNGYDKKTVRSIYRYWIWREWRNNTLMKGHAMLKKILPRKLLDYLSKNIN